MENTTSTNMEIKNDATGADNFSSASLQTPEIKVSVENKVCKQDTEESQKADKKMKFESLSGSDKRPSCSCVLSLFLFLCAVAVVGITYFYGKITVVNTIFSIISFLGFLISAVIVKMNSNPADSLKVQFAKMFFKHLEKLSNSEKEDKEIEMYEFEKIKNLIMDL